MFGRTGLNPDCGGECLCCWCCEYCGEDGLKFEKFVFGCVCCVYEGVAGAAETACDE